MRDKIALEMRDFIEQCKSLHLTIADVKNMKVGDQIEVVLWDGNFEEYWIWDNAKNEEAYDPKEFFKKNRNRFTYTGDMKWIMKDPENDVHPIHLHLSDFIKETNWTWSAIEDDGFIHITSERIIDGEKIPKEKIPSEWKAKHIYWTEFPDSTRVGWRGPVMLWDKLSDLPQVYLK